MADASLLTADAVLAHINALELSLTPTVTERSYADWEEPLETSRIREEDELRVDVVPVAVKAGMGAATRGGCDRLVGIDIAVRKRFGPEVLDDDTLRVPNELVDPLVEYTYEILRSLINIRLEEYDNAAFVDVKPLVVPMKSHLRKHKQFTGVVRVEFEVYEELP